MNAAGTVVLSFCNGNVVVHLRVNKSVSVTKKGSIIIKDKKLSEKKK